MPTDDVITIVSKNVIALMEQRWGKQNISRLGKCDGLSNGTAQRLVYGDTAYGVDKVEAAAKAFGLEAWQLLVPDLDPSKPPSLDGDTKKWPIPPVDAERYMRLSETSRAYVQGYLGKVIEEREAVENSKTRTG